MKSGLALVAVLAIIAAVVIFSGVAERLLPVPQLSETAQQELYPDKPVSKFPFITFGKMKDVKTKLDVKKATLGIVENEINEKTAGVASLSAGLLGTFEKPGLLGSGVIGLLSGIGTWLYAKSKLYTPDEVKLIKNGEQIL